MQGRNERESSSIVSQEVIQPKNQRYQEESIFGRFTENLRYLEDPLEYRREGSEPGLVLVFNQETFDNGSPTRDGSLKDVEDIVTCLTRLGFNISSKHIFTDLTKDEIFKNVDAILASDLSEYNSVLVFVLTHGDYENYLHSRTTSFLADEFWLKFVRCPKLDKIPKMFTIQACKGTEKTTSSGEVKDTLLVPMSTFSIKNIFSDMLIVYSTLEGKYAFRHNTNGTWLIQEICKNFTAYGRRDDVFSMLTRVIKCVSKNYFDQEKQEVVKQLPVIVSTLSKKFYLNKNKDRHHILESIENQVEILKLSRSIREKVVTIHRRDEETKNTKDKAKSSKK
ncbi:hypothetical protein HHI36_019296 [Cryptolaemus montrouzieri]|uniref:Uncharacterized protein n=1 Tax=Cryptolaemus montrouzieri TaxID=559131 RepID=A0ABD2P389_9CUCU